MQFPAQPRQARLHSFRLRLGQGIIERTQMPLAVLPPDSRSFAEARRSAIPWRRRRTRTRPYRDARAYIRESLSGTEDGCFGCVGCCHLVHFPKAIPEPVRTRSTASLKLPSAPAPEQEDKVGDA